MTPTSNTGLGRTYNAEGGLKFGSSTLQLGRRFHEDRLGVEERHHTDSSVGRKSIVPYKPERNDFIRTETNLKLMMSPPAPFSPPAAPTEPRRRLPPPSIQKENMSSNTTQQEDLKTKLARFKHERELSRQNLESIRGK